MDIALVPAGQSVRAAQELAALLQACVADGASLGFLHPTTAEQARAFWQGALTQPGAMTWVARDDDRRLLGTVRLIPSPMPNAGHRADVAKLMVHPAARGRGVAAALMAALEDAARATGRTLLVLDTETGSRAEAVYRRWGWERVGVIPDYATDPGGALRPTTIMTKRL
ncbi:GNAT family N-acetyltransferase [Georgenia thermotolerans]|uniref:GNAT family N-acetyltransferase n=1 Tax=Georgenia thermotolerans TaxID=527326 RepID=A0A7J5UUR9_9MICO|nr:GNAT family N-acetyltransferase [Georgenia thermotolerans]KAE8766035.1 GNAT family N-acetyltransferase [Georgenia thermotolerans]